MGNTTHSEKFSWISLLWLLIYFWYFSSLLQLYVLVTGQSNSIGLRDSLLYSSLWLIPALLFPKKVKLIAGVIGIVLWLSSVVALAYFVVYGHQISQSVMFVMFETNTNEAGEFLKQYFSFKVLGVILAYTVVAIFLWTRLKPVTLPKPGRIGISLLILVILFGIPYYNKGIKQDRPIANVASYLNSKLAYAAPWQFVSGYLLYKNQLANMEELIRDNSKIPPLENFVDANGDTPRTFVLVIGESTSRDRMSLYGYSRPTTPELDELANDYPANLSVFNDVVTSRPYTIEALQQILTFATQTEPELFNSRPSIMNMMKQAGFKTFWITNQQTMTERNTLLTAFSRQTDKQYYLNNDMAQSSRIYDDVVFSPFKEALADPAEKKFIVVHLLGTHMRYEFRYPEDKAIFKDKDSVVPANLNDDEVKDYNAYDNAQYYNDYVVSTLIKDFDSSKENGFLVFFSDHGEDVYDTPPHKMLGRSEGKPSKVIYNVPFLVWQSPEWLSTHQFDLNDKTARPFSNMDFIYAWSDLAGLNYTGFEPEKSLFNEAFKPQPRYIGDPDNKSSLMLYDDLKQ
ncbi:phosphoethanolamine transferase CptA [Providencia huaxiensis]|uniref:Phosphoethanolamine transferase CptA n=1 Tax=Providencia huaxiensis TaxID=2027290 RepID=A0A345LWT3_9GAMM|nr:MULTISPECIES: phosphoethanolamine transferase CptA [Providencia]QLR02092.1 phosphoethanolamine transferase CptA [Providencia rettgeri]AXH62573.1 phosphoethanolamine transferase CptA [Providencia huaxiensis]MBN6362034.1 phosphoethanolamine transferase CptA [Providencia huaxiensis]MBQ0270215.1 phosphoethanolamine transferase CptA [Providencia huaxiensis]MBQ0536079.1 phosphoethanolamine transferase CptA [Providencia huaxiensis]